ncbi:MAG TPA: DUF4180 domain-containing protein [Candidatus Baltobacteraceae bacterium]|nr:DUF4180 domain-containing protein [Candidatus Baltobacteraceae bacterium]
MTTISYNLHGVQVLACSADGEKLRTDRDAVDLIGEAFGHHARLIVIPTERFEEGFFDLRTRIAGEILSKLVQYRLRVAVVGDISRRLAESSALRAFVYESNRGDQILFVASAEELAARLEAEQKAVRDS